MPSNGKVGAILNTPHKIEEITPLMLEQRSLESYFNAPSSKLWQPQLYRWQPRHLNNRISSQHSVFLLGGNQVIYPDKECIIEAGSKENILKSLESCSNITGKTLFPDLEGFASQHGHNMPFPNPDYINLGHHAYQSQEYEEAILHYTKAINWHPKDANPYFWRGHARVNIQQYQEAIEDFDEVIRLGNPNPNVYEIRGYAKSCLCLKIEARQDYQTGLQLAKQNNNEKYIEIIENALRELNSDSAGGT